MVTGDMLQVHIHYSLRHHILLQFRNDSGIADAKIEDMCTAHYMPLIDRGEDNETEQVCQTALGEGIEGEGGWDILVNKIVVGGLLLPLPIPK
jgi:hypothetical protein